MRILLSHGTFSVMRTKEVLPFATAWMDVEDIMQSEISEAAEKDKYCINSVICGI